MPYNGELLLACDIDDTLLPRGDRTEAERDYGAAALAELCMVIETIRGSSDQPFYFGSATGRTMTSHRECELQRPEFAAAAAIMDFNITSVGTEVHRHTPRGFVHDTRWPATNWNRAGIARIAAAYDELELQPSSAQTPHKLSFNVLGETGSERAASVARVSTHLADSRIAAEIIFSSGDLLDFLPKGVNKGTALRYLIEQLTLERQERDLPTPEIRTVAAGDSINDCELLREADTAILPGNAHPELVDWAHNNIPSRRLYYVREAPFAAGILEGMRRAELIAA